MCAERATKRFAAGVVTAVLAVGCGGGDGAGPDADTSSTVAATTVVTTSPADPTDTDATAAAATTTTTIPAPVCVVTVEPGDFLAAIVDRVGGDVTVDGLKEENWLDDDHVIHPGDRLDVCVGNDMDDVTGASRLPPPADAVMIQQRKLNELFEPYAIPELLVDGISGPLTRQLLCAARIGLGLPATTGNMPAGSADEELLLAADSISIPAGAATWARRWILVDETCQVMFTGEGAARIVEVFPTSTGEPGHETHNVQAVAAYRYDPAVDNDGWHDSSRYPADVDNPLNGNMYKPLYFNGGQAIHGADVVPPDPRSKGCARLYPWDQDSLIEWLGLAELTEVTWQKRQIDATVTVQGEYRSSP